MRPRCLCRMYRTALEVRAITRRQLSPALRPMKWHGACDPSALHRAAVHSYASILEVDERGAVERGVPPGAAKSYRSCPVLGAAAGDQRGVDQAAGHREHAEVARAEPVGASHLQSEIANQRAAPKSEVRAPTHRTPERWLTDAERLWMSTVGAAGRRVRRAGSPERGAESARSRHARAAP
jgi:hypothetical protein